MKPSLRQRNIVLRRARDAIGAIPSGDIRKGVFRGDQEGVVRGAERVSAGRRHAADRRMNVKCRDFRPYICRVVQDVAGPRFPIEFHKI